MKNYPKSLKEEGAFLLPSMLLLVFKKEQEIKEVNKLLSELDLLIYNQKEQSSRLRLEVNNSDRRFWIKAKNGKEITQESYEALTKNLKRKIDWIGPVYYVQENEDEVARVYSISPNVIILDKEMANNKKIQSRLKESKIILDERRSKYLSKHNVYKLEGEKSFNIVDKFRFKKRTYEYEKIPLFRDFCVIPNDPLFVNQWNMNQIQAPTAWDITTGANTVLISVIDSGVDLTHPDLNILGPGIDLGDMVSNGSPNPFGSNTGHGTCCAGIVSAAFNNNLGVTGIAGNCRVLPVAISTFSNLEIANGINWSVAQGASVISMSFSIGASALVDTEIANAIGSEVTLCAATGNGNSTTISYPSRNSNVIACGASSTDDNRKSPTTPDGETWWGADYGDIVYNGITTGVSVVAPGVLIPTTDIQGNQGYNPSGGLAGNYFQTFNGTSSATPLVAGAVALIYSQYPGITAAQVRSILEKTAAKVGSIAYAEDSNFSNGTRNQEMGYGRVDIFQALDFADTMIKDWSGDDGTEASTPPGGNFWSFSDIVVRITDDNVFNPSNPSQSKHVERGQTNFIYVRVTNNGPNDARNVSVNIRITPYVGLQFVYPNDWTLIDGMHVNPTSLINNFASIPAGGTEIAKFSVSAAQVEDLWGWQNSNPWHPCLLAEVVSDNDFAYQSSDLSFGNIVLRKNNFAQRNLSVIDVFSSALLSFPFVVGSLFKNQRDIRLAISTRNIPDGLKLRLKIDENDQLFPRIKFNELEEDIADRKIEIYKRSCIGARVGGCDAKLDLEKGSVIYLFCDKSKNKKLDLIHNEGGKLYKQGDVSYLELDTKKTLCQFKIEPRTIHPLSVELQFPEDIDEGQEFFLSVYQIDDQNKILGGASALYRFKK